MANRNFMQMLRWRWNQGYFVCVGLDSELLKIPEAARKLNTFGTMLSFNQSIVGATKDLVCAYKPNMAFYEMHGGWGLEVLAATLEHIRRVAPEVPVILDAKRADIGKTNDGYAAMAFDCFQADAITVNPYFGREALKPFLDWKDKGIIILCRTSNPGAGEFQDLLVDGVPLYQVVARHVAETWNSNGNCAVVAGATYPEELARIRRIVGKMPILIPGVGKQGGDVGKAVEAGQDEEGQGIIVNSSGAIIFASSGPDYAEAARCETQKLHNEIRKNL